MAKVNEFVDRGDMHWVGSTGVYLRLCQERFIPRSRASQLAHGLVLRDLDSIVSNPAAFSGIIDALQPKTGALVILQRTGAGWAPVTADEAIIPGFPEAAMTLLSMGVECHLRLSHDVCFVKLQVDGVELDIRFVENYRPAQSVTDMYDMRAFVPRTVARARRDFVCAEWACKQLLVCDTIWGTKPRRALTCSEALERAFVGEQKDVSWASFAEAYKGNPLITRSAYLRDARNLNKHDSPIVNAFIACFA